MRTCIASWMVYKCMFVFMRVDISMVVIYYASDIIEYD